jgi:hypothetical protein
MLWGIRSFFVKMVLSPDARKIPPPTRLGLVLSLTALVSAKSLGPEGVIGSGDAMLDDFKEREDTASKVPEGIDEAESEMNVPGSDGSTEATSAVVVGKTFPEESMIFIGTRLR